MTLKIRCLLCLLLFCPIINLYPQHVTFSDDAKERGYYNRPYKRYEAEAGKCITNGNILPAGFDQSLVQSEASNQVATQLIHQHSYIQWTNKEAADGMVIRFSLPHNETGSVALYVDDVKKADILLDSYWSWQYFSGTENVAYNEPIPNAIVRMRFDETRIKLSEKIPAGSVFKLVKTDHNTIPYTIDFVELEPVPEKLEYGNIADPDKVKYVGNGSDLRTFILHNGGKTIYIPAGIYTVPEKININTPHTKIITAGMWYTQLHFTADQYSATDYNNRGIECNAGNVLLDGLYITTQSNMRYFGRDDSKSIGKALDGCFGTGSVIKNVWIQHFDNGAWIANYTSNTVVADGLHVINCRFRDNYADGINLCKGSKNCIVEYCSFRNNGDDDMATWSANGQLCENNEFRYNTAENNWRASSIGFFGGKQNKAHHCVIIDPVEMALRIDATFPGVAFSTDGFTEFHDISVYNGGTSCDVWRNDHRGAIGISLGGAKYNIKNVSFRNIDLHNSKQDAVSVNKHGTNPYSIAICMENIYINGTGSGNGFYVDQHVIGNVIYKNVLFQQVNGKNILNNASASTFSLTETTGNKEACVILQNKK